jgi:hypothetical protein
MATRYLHATSGDPAGSTGSHASTHLDTATDELKFEFGGTVHTVATKTAKVETVTATNVLTASESGKTIYLSAAAGFVTTLPAAAAGLEFDFIVKTAPTSNGYTITADPADSIYGTVAANGAEDTVNGVTAAGADNVILVANVALKGDRVKFQSDGTDWFVSGGVNTFAAITANG